MTDVNSPTGVYRENFERFQVEVAASEPAWVGEIRRAAMSSFTKVGFPTTGDEAWRYTSVDPITQTSFRAAEYPLQEPEVEEVAVGRVGVGGWRKLVFLNGRFSKRLSSMTPVPKGLTVGSLAAALTTEAACLEAHLARHARYEDRAFVALNTAFMRDGAVVYVPENTVLEEPIQLVYVSTASGAPIAAHLRNLIVLGPSSRATIVEHYAGLGNGLYWTNAVTELALGANAAIDHYRLQQEDKEAFHIGTLDVSQDRGSHCSALSLALGGALVRNEINILLGADQAECFLAGLYAGRAHQLIDFHTKVDHAKPHCTSRQLFKAVLDGYAKGVFTGNVLVRQDAQNTDARQTSKNLLLSEDAVMHTTPQLEILADDVTCTHGATVGQLDEDAMFYLRSRGIGREAARDLMISAFAGDIIGQIMLEPLRTYIGETMSRWIAERVPAGKTLNA